MITTAMAASIAADRERVWRALTDTSEIVRWDASRTGAVDTPERYPEAGRRMRWRYRLGSVSVVLKETPRLIEAPHRLAASCTAGSLRFEQTWVLHEEPEERAQAARTRVSLKVAAGNRVQLIGAEIDRFEVRRMLIGRVDATLRELQKWCENVPPDARRSVRSEAATPSGAHRTSPPGAGN